MSEQLSEDQLKRIKSTLARIRGGLSRVKVDQFREPAHIFVPGALSNVEK
ncbi:hypothetical protein [Leisingera daeponensis]|nr:hypothetical protein [Leisingera daeponensis]MBY6059699.1 hypothetical protein [Leisingera daeponensis]